MYSDDHAYVSTLVPISGAAEIELIQVRRCITSICTQTFAHLDICVIVSGISAELKQMLSDLITLDDRIRVITHDEDGYAALLNRGLAEATGDWISIVEPTDYIDPTMYSDMLKLASEFHQRLDIVKTPWFYVFNGCDPMKRTARPCEIEGKHKTTLKATSVSERRFLMQGPASIWSALYHKDFLAEHAVSFQNMASPQEVDEQFRRDTLERATQIVYLDEPYYYHHV